MKREVVVVAVSIVITTLWIHIGYILVIAPDLSARANSISQQKEIADLKQYVEEKEIDPQNVRRAFWKPTLDRSFDVIPPLCLCLCVLLPYMTVRWIIERIIWKTPNKSMEGYSK